MVSTTERELLTIEEAASLLGVDASTIGQWVDSGKLPSVAVQTTVIRVKRQDVVELASTQPSLAEETPRVGLRYVTSEEELRRKLSEEEIQAQLAAFHAVDKERERMLAARGGELFPPSWELIREGRDER